LGGGCHGRRLFDGLRLVSLKFRFIYHWLGRHLRVDSAWLLIDGYGRLVDGLG
jgi:hypothetical protein